MTFDDRMRYITSCFSACGGTRGVPVAFEKVGAIFVRSKHEPNGPMLLVNLGTAGTVNLSRNMGPHSLEFCFEDGDKAVADIASLSLKHGSH